MTSTDLTKGERTRRAIMDAAREIIIEQGYTAASMRQIGEAAGITPAAIYNHFDSKEALFSAVLQEVVPLEELTAFLKGLSAGTAEGLLEEMFRGILRIVAQHEDYVRLALIDAQEREGATLATFIPRFFPLLLGFVQRMRTLDGEDGRLRDLPPHLVARTIVSLTAGYFLTERVARMETSGVFPEADWASGLLEILKFGLFERR